MNRHPLYNTDQLTVSKLDNSKCSVSANLQGGILSPVMDSGSTLNKKFNSCTASFTDKENKNRTTRSENVGLLLSLQYKSPFFVTDYASIILVVSSL